MHYIIILLITLTSLAIAEYVESDRDELYNGKKPAEIVNKYLNDKKIYLSQVSMDKIVEKKNLALDLSLNQDIDFLLDCNNLENLIIFNSQLLTSDNLTTLKNMKCNNIKLSFGVATDIVKLLPNKLDLSEIDDKNIEIYTYDNSNELDIYILLLYLENYHEKWFKNKIDFVKYGFIDSKLDTMIENMDIKTDINNYENIMKIVAATTNLINYDPVVSKKYEDENASKSDKLSAINKSHYYNDNLLSSVLIDNEKTDNNDVYGVCSNYAAVMTALSNKLGVQCFYVTGSPELNLSDSKSLSGHAWCVISTNNGYKIVDITAVDNDYDNFLELENKELYIENLEEITFTPNDINQRYEGIDILDKSNDVLNTSVYDNEYSDSIDYKTILNNFCGNKITALAFSIIPAQFINGFISITLSSKSKRKEEQEETEEDYNIESYSDDTNNIDDMDIYFNPHYKS